MTRFFMQCGVIGWPLLVIAGLNTVLVVRAVLGLWRAPRAGSATTDAVTRGERDAGLEYGIHAILFWGVLAALLGFLGQTTGLYKALTVIAGAREISPVMVAQGFAESLTTTLFGMVLLVLSAVAWFGLHAAYRRVAGRAALHAVSG